MDAFSVSIILKPLTALVGMTYSQVKKFRSLGRCRELEYQIRQRNELLDVVMGGAARADYLEGSTSVIFPHRRLEGYSIVRLTAASDNDAMVSNNYVAVPLQTVLDQLKTEGERQYEVWKYKTKARELEEKLRGNAVRVSTDPSNSVTVLGSINIQSESQGGTALLVPVGLIDQFGDLQAGLETSLRKMIEAPSDYELEQEEANGDYWMKAGLFLSAVIFLEILVIGILEPFLEECPEYCLDE